ncbi:type 1 glutamine amidotransferase domain-containing protein [Streptomyces sp. AC1-42W]|uniref:type 1 glutamine amidotransferase domain-containing protein n=1 Tax=Streptomyces sp. AC1-42W TaxID=2218666 RepID=UPI001314C66F|nr:type 1 glutamine amidotransferase domain-containing protein [Streptomyces sp. AC1-42W]
MPTHSLKGLIVLSSTERLPGGRSAGFWLPEAAYPWRALLAGGWDFEFTSTRSGRPPAGGIDRSDPPQRMFLEDPVVQERLEHTRTPDLLTPEDYGIVFVAGGHGAIIDLPGDERLTAFLAAYWASRETAVIAAVCHGVAALLDVPGPDGAPLVAGRRMTGFTRDEERAVGLDQVVPYFLGDALTERGALYEAGEPFRSHVVADGALLTGQNPASAADLARRAVELASGRPLPRHWLRRSAPVTR